MKPLSVALLAWLLTVPTISEARPRPPKLGGELRLDLSDPVVTARIGDIRLRLRVDLDQRDSIELNPAAAARLPILFEAGGDAEVGRVVLPGRMAIAELTIEGQKAQIQLATHGRDCCELVDGTIGAALLPFEVVRFVGGSADPPTSDATYPMRWSKEAGLEIRQDTPAGAIMVQLSLQRRGVLATKAGGAVLARAYGGHLATGYSHVSGPFGIERPVRAMTLSRPAVLAGFAVDRLLVRTADFGGRRTFPGETAQPGEIVVRRRTRAHHDWPAILLGREYLERCSEVIFTTVTRIISLRCSADISTAPLAPS